MWPKSMLESQSNVRQNIANTTEILELRKADFVSFCSFYKLSGSLEDPPRGDPICAGLTDC